MGPLKIVNYLLSISRITDLAHNFVVCFVKTFIWWFNVNSLKDFRVKSEMNSLFSMTLCDNLKLRISIIV